MAYKKKFDGNTDKTIALGKPGDPKSIEGYFLGTKVIPGTAYGDAKLHIFQTSEGTIGVWGKTRLNNLLTTELVGQMTLVEFTGMVQPTKKGRRPSFGYQVSHDEDNTIDTGGIDLSAPQEPESDESEDSQSFDQDDLHEDEVQMKAAKSPDPSKRAKVEALLKRK